MTRMSRDEIMMWTAKLWAERGTCLRLQVGAVLAIQGRIISTGYVGAPSGVEHCNPSNCDPHKPCTRTLHAESNALDFASLYGISPWGATLYTTHSPCLECAKRIANVRVQRVVYLNRYRDPSGIKYLELRGVTVEEYHAGNNASGDDRGASENRG